MTDDEMTDDAQPAAHGDEAQPNIRAYLHDDDVGMLARRGGQATVRLQERDGQTVAIRTPHPVDPQSSSSWSAGGAQGSGEVPAAWDHPHLVKILGSSAKESPAERSLVLEAVPGGSVADLIQARGPLPMGEAVTLLVPVAQALEHLHEHGALHGDVGPQNVMFRSDGAPVVIDPGNARVLGAAPADSGTEGFAARDAHPDQRSDISGWGALAWFVLTGTPPPPEAQRIPLPLVVEGISPEAARLIEDCLAIAPEERPVAGELADVLWEHHKPVPLDSYPAVGHEGRALMLTRRPASGHAPWSWWRRLRAPGLRMPRTLAGSLALSLGILAMGGVAATIIVMNKPVLATAGQLPSAGPAHHAGITAVGKAARDERGQRTQTSVSDGSSSSEDGHPATQTPTREDAVRTLTQRVEALVQRDATLLRSVYAPKTAALKADTHLIEKLRSTSQTLDGLSLSVTSLEFTKTPTASATVEAVASVSTSKYRLLDESGTVTSTYPARTDRLELTFKRRDRGWRIHSIRSAAPTSSERG